MNDLRQVTKIWYFYCMRKGANIARLLLFILIMETWGIAQAQSNKNTSGLKDDTLKVLELSRLSFQYFIRDPVIGLEYGAKAEALARKLNYSRGLAAAYHSIGSNFWAQNNFKAAQIYFWKAFNIYDSLGDWAGKTRGRHSLAVIYEAQKNYDEALESYKIALNMNLTIKDSEHILGCYSNIAEVYEKKGEYSKALAYEDSTMVYRRLIREEPKHTRYVAYTESKIGIMHARNGNLATALAFQDSALSKYRSVNDSFAVAYVFQSIAQSFALNKQYDSALYYYQQAFDMYAQIRTHESRGQQGRMLSEIGNVYREIAAFSQMRMGIVNMQKAKESYIRALPFSAGVSDKENMMYLYQKLYQIDSSGGRFKGALDYYKLYSYYFDSVKMDEDGKAMSEMEQIYLIRKYTDSLTLAQTTRQQAEKIKTQSILLYATLIFIVMAAVVIWFFYRQRREKSIMALQKAELNAEVQQLKMAAISSQMNPHFIFNVLNTLQSYIYSADKKKATDYLAKFGILMRKILSNSNKSLISIEEEIEMLNLYMQIEQARYGEQFFYQINVDASINTNEISIPPMLLQPYVENAIRHGLLHKEGEKHLCVAFNRDREDGMLLITIEDNGIGRQQSKAYNSIRLNHQSFANEANERRVAMISQLYQKDASVEFEDLLTENGTPAGTKVLIHLPVLLNDN